jgi:hypothetical protein
MANYRVSVEKWQKMPVNPKSQATDSSVTRSTGLLHQPYESSVPVIRAGYFIKNFETSSLHRSGWASASIS